MKFKTGQRLWLACEIKDGMFPDERSVHFVLPKPEKKIISAFVPQEFVKVSNGRGSGQVAVVITGKPEDGKVPILFPGEILTSTNPVRVDASWLSRHVS